ncbi:MAG: phosphatidate cytidylyltransferase, partial [Planctomycetes bacterium]|nr:phosphatidate cytidylyltransferase [Planctomycetota bacterium]
MGAKQIRYLLGIVLLLAIAGVLAFDSWLDKPIAGSAILVVMGLVGHIEFSKMSTGRRLGFSTLPGLLATTWFLAVPCWYWEAEGFGLSSTEQQLLLLGVFALLFLSFLTVLFRKDFLARAGEVAPTVLGALLFGLLFSFVIRIYCRCEDVLTAAVFVFGIKLTDIGGYVAGSTIGRTRFLNISPKKTLEGFIAGFLLTGACFALAA